MGFGSFSVCFISFWSWPVSHTGFCGEQDELQPSTSSLLAFVAVKLRPFVPPTISGRCEFSTPVVFTEQAAFELAKRNVCLKCLFDGEPNLFSPLKSLLERSEMWADVEAGAHPERPLPSCVSAARARTCVCVSVCVASAT